MALIYGIRAEFGRRRTEGGGRKAEERAIAVPMTKDGFLTTDTSAPGNSRLSFETRKGDTPSALYSCLTATNGSTLVARIAGTRVAMTATTQRTSATIENVAGSVGSTPKS